MTVIRATPDMIDFRCGCDLGDDFALRDRHMGPPACALHYYFGCGDFNG